MDIKDILAQNLVVLRKTSNLTQIELAEKINYTDKAISKWERGEAIPELPTLKQIADFYGVTIDYLITEHITQTIPHIKNKKSKRIIISLLSGGLVWLLATIFFVIFGIIVNSTNMAWLAFIYAIPVSAIVFLVFSSMWGRNVFSGVFTSIIVWGVILSLYLTLIMSITNPPQILWLLFLIGVPLQILIVLWFFLKHITIKFKKNK